MFLLLCIVALVWHSWSSPNSHFEHMFISICRDWRICTPEIQLHRSFLCFLCTDATIPYESHSRMIGMTVH